MHNLNESAKPFIFFLTVTFVVSLFFIGSPSEHKTLQKRQITLPSLPILEPTTVHSISPPTPSTSILPTSTIDTPSATPAARTTPAKTSSATSSSTPSASTPAPRGTAQQEEATKKQNTILIPCLVVGSCILLAVIGIYAFRKSQLRPSNGFKRRLESEKFSGSASPAPPEGASMKRPGVVTYGNLPPPLPQTVVYTTSTTQPQYYTTTQDQAYYPPNQQQQQGYYQPQNGYYQNHQQY